MLIGIPREVKPSEYRVGMVPAGVRQLTAAGHKVMVQAEAGAGSGIPDRDFESAGAEIVGKAPDIFSRAEMVVKVKEPQESEQKMMRKGQILFTYFHFASSKSLALGCLRSGATCLAYETLEDHDSLPLLVPMSEIAGKMAIQEGAKYLEKPMMGRGILLGGVPGVEKGTVTILGGGVVGASAAKVAAGLGANVYVLDVNLARLRYLQDILPPNVHTLHSNPDVVMEKCIEADLVVGAVLVSGARAPRLVPREYLKRMKPGSVIVDVAVDQGGCVETTKPTTHENPTYIVDGVVHYCVANMPGAVGRTSTFALTNATFPYVMKVAGNGVAKLARESKAYRTAANIINGKCTHPSVAAACDLAYCDPVSALA